MRVVLINGIHRYCVYYRSFEFTRNDRNEYEKRIKIIAEEIEKDYKEIFYIFNTTILINCTSNNISKCEFCIYSKNEQVFL